MTTTAIVVELLVVGMQALVWLLPLVSLFSPELAASLVRLRAANDPLVVGLSFAAVYTLGVLADTAARGIVLPIQSGTWLLEFRWVSERANLAQEDARIRIAAKESTLDNLINYYVVRARVLRGIAFNSNLAALLWLLIAAVNRTPKGIHISRQISVTIGLAALAVGLLSGITFALDQAGYQHRIREMDRISGQIRREGDRESETAG